MKKTMFCILAMLVSLTVCAQKIKVNEVDKFTKKKVVETSFEKIASDKSVLGSTGGRIMKSVWAGFKKVDDTVFLRLKWCSNKIVAVDAGADIILLDADGNSYQLKNVSHSLAESGAGTVGFAGSAIPGVDLYVTGDLQQLENKEITSLRIYTTDGYVDFELGKSDRGTISKAYELIKNN